MAKKSRRENCGPAKIVVLWETLTTAPRKSSGYGSTFGGAERQTQF
jgi:hypothetical protein